MKGDDLERRRESKRVALEVGGRLAARGIRVVGNESSDELTTLEEAVERFEEVVESHGGDLMVDEPPIPGSGRPDDPRFLLPTRTPGMSVAQYVELLAAAVDNMRARRHKR